MPDTPLLDFASLIAPISGDSPAGGPVPFEIKHKLEDFRKEINPDDYGPDDPLRPKERKPADWLGIVELSSETLTDKSKDLLLAARLTEALAKAHGFAGVRDGLRLMRELVEQAWDRLSPPIEDGDLEVRAGPLYWLDDPDRGARFPSSIRLLPLIYDKDNKDSVRYSWVDWKESIKEKGGAISREDFQKVVTATPAASCVAVAACVNQSMTELDGLVQALSQEGKMGHKAPSLAALRESIEGCRALINEIVGDKRPDLAGDTHISEEQPKSAAAGGSPRAPTTRAEVYRQLSQAAAVLRELEPHSPIPYLIQRAVELGSLPFPQLINALIRDDAILNELRREFGIQPPPES